VKTVGHLTPLGGTTDSDSIWKIKLRQLIVKKRDGTVVLSVASPVTTPQPMTRTRIGQAAVSNTGVPFVITRVCS
jgi:hypothetical protein